MAFYRVSGARDLGEYVGQWRLAEGEFGEPLAKHRLKSIWNFYRPDAPTSSSALAFFTEATLQIHYLEAGQRKVFTGTLAELPESEVTAESQEIEVRWRWGQVLLRCSQNRL